MLSIRDEKVLQLNLGHGYRAAQEIIKYAKSVRPEKIVSFDTETTGLTNEDEVLQLSIADGYGRPLLNEYVRPQKRSDWPEAQAIHEISFNDVKSCPTFKSIIPKAHRIFSSAALILAYNIEFDDRMLRQSGYSLRDSAPATPCVDVMLDYAPIAHSGDGYRWVSLKECAKHYQVNFNAHNSLEDARATALCFRSMLKDPEYQEHCVVPEDISRIREPHVQSTNEKNGYIDLRFPIVKAFEHFLSRHWDSKREMASANGRIIIEKSVSVIADNGEKIATFNEGTEEYHALEPLVGGQVALLGRMIKSRGKVLAKLYLRKK